MENLANFTIPVGFDAHLHLRDGRALETTVPHTAALWGSAIVMPNLKPAIRTVGQALDYRERILANVPADVHFNPLMTLYLTLDTSDDDLHEVVASYGKVVACKLYPAGATTNSSEGIPDVEKAYRIFGVMQKNGIPLCVHGEVTDPSVDVFDREAVFIDRHLSKIVETFPDLRVVFEHITTKEGVEFVESCGKNVAASITAHHLLFNRNAIFQGGVRPHWYCLPILKRDVHQQALVRAATSGSDKFFAGTDSAPHPKNLKEASCGCAGCYTAPQGLAAYAEVFDREKKFEAVHDNGRGVEEFSRFVSTAAPSFYRVPKPQGLVRLSRVGDEYGVVGDGEVPAEYAFGDSSVVPLFAGETMKWTAARVSSSEEKHFRY